MMTVQGEIEYVKKSMAAGARDYVVKPFSNEELLGTVKKIYHQESRRRNAVEAKGLPKTAPQTVALFSTKGGVGKTTLAVNLAVALHQLSGKSVVLADLDLQFGDIAALLNLLPRQSIAQLVQEAGPLDGDLLQNYLISHISSGISVLPAPLRPEYADLVTPQHIEQILKLLQQRFEYIIADTSSYLNENVLATLDVANVILMVVGLDLPTIKDAKLALEVLQSLGLKDKVRLVLNRASPDFGLRWEDVERTLEIPIMAQIPSAGKVVVSSINKGVPFMVTNPTSPVAESIDKLAHQLLHKGKASLEGRQSLLAGVFSLLGR
ncbi:MAG TPA: response regulator/pilus assembly protein [Clostridia bacterium]|nr:response regulator/pilus assembly protein [Clostridia bacterium]